MIRPLPLRADTAGGVRVGSEALVYDERDRTLHLLNPTAAAIWFACDGAGSVEDLVEEFAATFAAPESEIERDVTTALRSLAERRLLAPGHDLLVSGPAADRPSGPADVPGAPADAPGAPAGSPVL